MNILADHMSAGKQFLYIVAGLVGLFVFPYLLSVILSHRSAWRLELKADDLRRMANVLEEQAQELRILERERAERASRRGPGLLSFRRKPPKH